MASSKSAVLMCRTIYTRACIPSRHWRNKGYEGVYEMDSKLIVYTVLAITLGYLFTSAIPAQLASSPFLAMQPESDDVRSPGAEEPPTGDEETLGQSEEDVGALTESESSAVKAAADDASTAASGLTGDYFTVFGTLIVNLTIALAVYMVARRRFA